MKVYINGNIIIYLKRSRENRSCNLYSRYFRVIIKIDLEIGLMSKELINLVSGDKNDFIIKENEILYQITSFNNQKNNDYENNSTILFEDFGDILKRIYNINNKYKIKGIKKP